MCGTFEFLVCFLNLLFLISVVDVLAVVGRTHHYRFPTNNSLRATIWLKSRRQNGKGATKTTSGST